MTTGTKPGVFLRYADEPGKVPAQGELANGEFAINEFDGKLFTRIEPDGHIRETNLDSLGNNSRITPSDGWDLSASSSGESISFNLSTDEVVVIDDIATLPSFWSVDLYFYNDPSGFQTAKLMFEAGAGQFLYRNKATSVFHLVGSGEGLRLTKITPDRVQITCIQQPEQAIIKRVNAVSNTPAYGSNAWQNMALSATADQHYDKISGGVTVPVSGLYAVQSLVQPVFIASGDYAHFWTHAGAEIYKDGGVKPVGHTDYLGSDFTQYLNQGENILARLLMKSTAYIFPAANFLSVKLLGR